MTTSLSVNRSNSWPTELNEVMLGKRPEGSDRLSGQQQASVPIVQNKDERAVFDEVFLPHMAERLHRTLRVHLDRKSTRLNSSHANISYAVFCLKKKKKPSTYRSRST